MSKSLRNSVLALGLAGAFAVGFALRAGAGLGGGAWFGFDAALHYRMTERAIAGTLGERDNLRFHPDGVRITDIQPTGLYAIGAATAAVSGAADPREVAGALRVLIAVAGALSILPAFFLARHIWHSLPAGLVAALAMAVVPAHVARTASSQYRFDAIGTLLIALQVTLVVWALSPGGRGSARRDLHHLPIATALLAAIAFLAAMAVWRAAIGIFALESILLAGIWLFPGARREVSRVALFLVCAMLLSLALPYVRAQGVLLSRSVLPALVLALATSLLGLRPELRRRTTIAAIATAAVLAVVVGRIVPATTFDLEEGIALRALLARVGFADAEPFVVRLYGYVAELTQPGPALVVREGYFSWLGALAFLGLAGTFLRRHRGMPSGADRASRAAEPVPGGRRSPGPSRSAIWFVVGLGAVALISAMVFQRNKIFATLPVCVAAGGAGALLTHVRSRWMQALVGLAIAGGLAITGTESARRAAELRLDAPPAARALYGWMRSNLPPGSAILTDWGNGYAVQTYAAHPTATDGHLELALNRDRIEAASRALVSPDERELEVFCREHAIDYVLVEIGAHWLPFVYAGIVGEEYARVEELQLPPEARHSTIVRLLRAPETLSRFSEVHREGNFRLFRRASPSR